MAAATRDWRDLRTRLISAAILAPAGLFSIWRGGVLFGLLLALLLVVAGLEWGGMVKMPARSLRGIVLAAWPSAALLAALVTGEWRQAAVVLIGPLVLGPLVATGCLAIGLGGLALLWLRLLPVPPFAAAVPPPLGWAGLLHGDWGGSCAPVLFVVLVVIGSDSGAYLAGRAIGGPKLAPSISPGKTRSGAVGGLFAAALIGAALAMAMSRPEALSLVAIAVCGAVSGAVLGVAAQAGDLAESALKRRCGVKDSGTLIPGHGGVLDRFDGLLAAAPVAALLSFVSPYGAAFWYAAARAF